MHNDTRRLHYLWLGTGSTTKTATYCRAIQKRLFRTMVYWVIGEMVLDENHGLSSRPLLRSIQQISRGVVPLVVVISSSCLFACFIEPFAPTPSASKVTINPPTMEFHTLQHQRRLVATARRSNGFPILGKDFVWSSSADHIASVDDSGMVVAVSGGVATIRASTDEVFGEARVIVSQIPDSATISPTSAAMNIGDTLRFTAQAFDGAGFEIAEEIDFVWSTRDNEIVTIDNTGLATAIESGSATISVGFGGGGVTAEIQVAESSFVARTPLAGLPSMIAIGPSGDFYVLQSSSGEMSRLSSSDYSVVSTISVGPTPRDIAFSPSGERAYVVLQSLPGVAVVDLAGDSVISTHVAPDTTLSVATKWDGSVFLSVRTNSYPGSSLYRFRTDQLPNFVAIDTDFFRLGDIVHHPSSPILYSHERFSNAINVVNTEYDYLVDFYPGIANSGVVNSIAINDDGTRLFSAGMYGIEEYDPQTLNHRWTMAPAGASISITRSGKWLYVANSIGEFSLIDTDARRVVRKIRWPGGHPHSVSVTPDGSLVALSNTDGWVDFYRGRPD